MTDSTSKVERCPGLYCGRISLGNNNYSECGACPRGYQPNEESICLACDSEPTFYDWMYLAFMALLSLVLHWFFIDHTNRKKTTKSLISLHISALLESVIAAILTLLLVEPYGSLTIRSCPVSKLSDWYSMLLNPQPNYTKTLYCTQEIVYPLYTIVMIYYAFSLLLMMLARPMISYKFTEKKGTKSIYAALYFHPVLIILQAMLSGLLYYSFSYLVIAASLITGVIHLSGCDLSSYSSVTKDIFLNGRNLTILVGHWFLHAFGIISLTQLTQLEIHLPILALVPFPTIFFIFTIQFSHPSHLEDVN
ncbi:JNK1/MAPK8-associated membrane protein-like isoform X2 [Saccostrea echinata]|uniref:JNK1/MAPK8-associated membrane protein-like isoform X2 n=1 Tax=Saccostrea echinata TaxID=191078 RepID=UPI002A7F333E|nr:JNK1/MAPK8-associated membrane protein-like isoform X2 [Saccostrea echinata]